MRQCLSCSEKSYKEVSALVSRTMATTIPQISVNPCTTMKDDSSLHSRCLFLPIPEAGEEFMHPGI